MKKLFLFLMLITVSLKAMESTTRIPDSDDDDGLEVLIRNNHPELYCFRLMEKINWVIDEMDRSVQEFTCKEEYEETMHYWERRLFNLQSKLKLKEIKDDL